MKRILIIIFFINLLYAVWSYSLTDPNLIVSSWEPFWNWQQWMWSLSDQTVTYLWLALNTGLLVSYFLLLRQKINFNLQQLLVIWALVSSPLLFANNALSHDVFNYMFNARMVLKYQVDPHVRVAQDFTYDPWTRFMHNIHTAAPYWYGWTGLSLPVVWLGQEIFLVTWIGFRAWNMLALAGLFFGIFRLLKQEKHSSQQATTRLSWLVFNPLIGVEILANAHNDAWMMMLAIWGMVLARESANKKSLSKGGWLLGALILLALSISIKYVTVVLLPVYLWLAFPNLVDTILKTVINVFKIDNYHELINPYSFAVFLLFVPLLTSRSQWFHPWYLVWALSFLPLISSKYLWTGLVGFSVASLFRYYPWMLAGAFEYTPSIHYQMRLITWLGGLTAAVVIYTGMARFKFMETDKL